MMNLENFTWPVRVYYEDTDAGGLVYHSNYLNFFERARTEKLRALGYEQDNLRDVDGVLFAVRSMQIDYHKPALFNQQLLISATISQIKKASLIFQQDIQLDSENPQTLCSAQVRIACIDAHTLSPKAIPDRLLKQFKHDN